jgi:hypothetical protein
MFIRQFSLRMLMAVITLCAGISLILSFAGQGRAWAIGLTAFLLLLLATMIVHGVVFWLVWLFSVAADRWQGRGSAGAARSGAAQLDRGPGCAATESNAVQQ